jgi:glycosyltransferase involved in cell wall biosynthesis
VPGDGEGEEGEVKVSLITTFRNEEEGIRTFLESIFSQSRLPDEIIMVDGGSTDGTVSLVRRYLNRELPARLIVERGCNISRGRNVAISASSHELIAVTDAGCILDTNWLDELITPMERDPAIDVVAGSYMPAAIGLWERVTSAYLMPFPAVACREMPSGRSTGFRRRVWEEVGSYPEWLDHAEDSYFAALLRKRGFRFHFAPRASVRWRPRADVRGFFLQYFRYGIGDGRAGLSRRHYLTKLVLFIFGAVLAADGLVAPLIALIALYFSARMGIYWFRGMERKLMPLLPGVILLHDLAQVTGFTVGTITGRKGK